MAIIIILGFTMLFMWGTIAFSYGSGAVCNGKYVLGITLLESWRNEEEVREIMGLYRRGKKRIDWIGLMLIVPMLMLNGYLSVTVAVLMLWFGLLASLHQENVRCCAKKLYAVKEKNGWFTGNTHVVRVDTALSARQDKGAVSLWWLLPAYLAGSVGCAWAWQASGGSLLSRLFGWGPAGIFVKAEVLLLLVILGIRKARSQVYCSDTNANQKIDKVMRYEWSRCITIHAYGVAVLAWYMGWRLRHGSLEGTERYVYEGERMLAVLGLLFIMGGTFYVVCKTYFRVKKVKEQVLNGLAMAGEEVYGDDDEYWLNGYPAGVRPIGAKQSMGLQEKRIGIGWTTNNSLQANTLDKAVLVFIAVSILGICLFLAPFDFAKITMEMDDTKCRIQAASMGCSFALEDVETVELVQKRPSMSKKSGYDSNRFFLGDFRVSGYGTCKVFLSLQNDMAVRVETKDKIVWFNSENPDETERFYGELSAALLSRRPLPGLVYALSVL